MEKSIEKDFNVITRKLVKMLENEPLSNDTLNHVCKKLFGSKFQGVFTQDKYIFKPNKFVIINTDVSSGDGIHWICMMTTNKVCYIFDSYGRLTQNILKHVVKELKKKKIKIIEFDRDVNQSDDSVICGHKCISMFVIIKKHGIKKALLI